MSSKGGKDNQVVRSFIVSTDFRDINRYPSPADFVYDLPVTLTNVEGVSIRDYKFRKEAIVNRNNNVITITGKRNGSAVSKTITLNLGDFGNNIDTIITDITNKLAAAPAMTYVTFARDTTLDKISITATLTTAGDYIIITSPFLDTLGFNQEGVCLYYGSAPTPTNAKLTYYNVQTTPTVYAVANYDVWNTSDLVVRITDVEALLAPHPVVNRSTAVLFSGGDSNTSSKQCLDHYMPLLQPQSRLQRLAIKLVNMNGAPYDTANAVFLVRFYCRDSASSPP